MAESLASLLLKLAELLQQEAQLLAGVRGEVISIHQELKFMEEFLTAADTMEESDSKLSPLLVNGVRRVAYDMENALDEFKLHHTRDHGHGFCACLHTVSHSIRDIKARHQFVSKTQAIRSQVHELHEEYKRYIQEHNITVPGPDSTRLLTRQGDALLLKDADLVGIEIPKRKLIEWLLERRPEREVVSVVGMGGLGKTTLVKKVYDDAEVKIEFKFRAWVMLTQSFKIEDLLKDMIRQLYRVLKKPEPQGMDSMDENKLRTSINKFLLKKRYLIVLDDVWDIAAWDAFKHVFPNNAYSSRVLLTTRNTGVASTSSMESPDKVYNMKPLSSEQSLTLFCKKLFQNNKCPDHLETVSDGILARCEGLPLAIVAITGVLATKDQSNIHEWEMVRQRLGAALEDEDNLASTRKILSLSYNNLPYHLKSCLLYFSIFPEGNPIEHMKLVRLWIAEGFVEVKERMTSEEVAEYYLSELIKRSLVQVVEATSNGRVKTCRIHDILREIILSKAKNQNFVAIANENSMEWPEFVRRLSTHNATPRLQQMGSKLRSLLMFWGIDSLTRNIEINLSSGCLQLLTVLDLEGAPVEKFPNEVFKFLLLKYLSLRNTKVSSVPSSIGKLQKLETLDLKHTHVTTLPVEILRLQKLRHLLVYRYEIVHEDQTHTKYGFKAPAGIGDLQSVQKLCFLDADDQGNNLMTELGRLNQLRRLGIIKLKRDYGRALCSSIEKMRNLRALSVTTTNQSEIIDMESLSSPPPFLERLYLTGRLNNLPGWISSLDSLVKVVLKWSQLSNDPLLSLQKLPNLVHLEFVQVYDGGQLCFRSGGFQKLKFLGLNKLDGLETTVVEKGAMPLLEHLIVQSCKLLHRPPLGIENLRMLKVLEIFDMPLELKKSLDPDTEDGDYSKVSHIPEVYFTYWNNGSWEIISLNIEDSASSSQGFARRSRHVWK